ncbi:hypothetical protein AOC36_10785 [Erysipelothrix larvae]|uniref:Uncharacterized protein n=1 Tax=Erysipelothrix larvae TaxID=1514105 RepID=A0A0X8H235_9FIRM|nr:hypothetical protein [Erysipelothrix larvae]AMC94439.1 hypothetical protein AOC36_10785 [Erysipelothrix larvae]
MKKIIETLEYLSPIILICMIFLGFFVASSSGDLLLTQYYLLYVAIVLTGFGIIKYSHRDLAMTEARFIHLDLKVKSIMFICLTILTLILTLFSLLHISYLIIFYLVIVVFLVELITLYKGYMKAKEREHNGNKSPYI